ncbi:MAG: hypothetical protein WAP08_06750 [Smithellaceae bacterium]|jgi:hypothetical protein|nr:hypothetical protein [Syntrophaceae bacterium]
MEKMLTLLTTGFGILCLLFLVLTVATVRKKKIFGSLTAVLCALLCFSLAALSGTIAVATKGYRALTHEEVAAVVRVEPAGEKRVTAHFRFADGREAFYQIAGDSLYVDAHILKWKPIANVFGLHTFYELDRVSGRYMNIEDELSGPRTLYSISSDKPLDIFNLRRIYPVFRPLLDCQYGSAAFINTDKPATLEIRVSTTGLLIRKAQ